MCDEVDVLAPDRGEHAVMRVDASAEGRYLHALRAPLMRADHAQQSVSETAIGSDGGPYASVHAWRTSGALRRSRQ